MWRTIIQPRVSETDGSGHINNTTIPVWLEAGREELFRLFTPNLSFADWKMVVAETRIRYLNQIFYGKKVEIRTAIERIGNSSLTLNEEIEQEGNLCVTATTVYVNFNFIHQKSEPIPETIRHQLLAHLIEK
ncbi:acyl-CoA thioesterase [Alicyclobacillus tolerans]|uniref:Acyl-CoA thioester hydrolase n=2 Tax=Alicyclobacillus tolerans TaxID=90970 RepID=A0A1M6SQX6_9BACL|nr:MULTISPECIES: thioesterase family protein [Alicyclobacillus]MDP9727142.1 acyl-CoA thioester hydrolase [Alicyclobacillus tengchongensis]QRF22911.1 acyl-CoA thioesterase [Alicyclobacillus sp. TC]SHK47154.1 acyl-CoA thioester hydrolase [Alicyclobacillus montanus]